MEDVAGIRLAARKAQQKGMERLGVLIVEPLKKGRVMGAHLEQGRRGAGFVYLKSGLRDSGGGGNMLCVGLIKIISGGQTGVDRGALDAALALRVACGGWCPAGRLDEWGRIPERYPVVELEGGGYSARTLRNIADSDGTLILYRGELKGGTAETARGCATLGKPCKLIDAAEIGIKRAIELAENWISKNEIAILNVAGPRASQWDEAREYALEVVLGLILARAQK